MFPEAEAVVGLTWVKSHLWAARLDGRIETGGRVLSRTDGPLLDLLSVEGSVWAWGLESVKSLDPEGQIASQQLVSRAHTVCHRNSCVWTASDSEVSRYQLQEGEWRLDRCWDKLPGPCQGFDVSPDGHFLLRIWPGQGNRIHVTIHDAENGQVHGEFKRGALTLQAAFAQDGSHLWVTGWQPQTITSLSFSGGISSLRPPMQPCGWTGPLFRRGPRLIVACQGGWQSYLGGSDLPEYSWSEGFQASHPWVVADRPQVWAFSGQPLEWDQRYARKHGVVYHRCPITAVASEGPLVALGFRNGSTQVHKLEDSAVLHQPMRAVGCTVQNLLLVDPLHNQLTRIDAESGQIYPRQNLSLDTFWPGEAWWWGQLCLDQNSLFMLDRYYLQCLDLASGQPTWKRERPPGSSCRRLLDRGSQLYFDQGRGGLLKCDKATGRHYPLPLPDSLGAAWQDAHLQLYPCGGRFLLRGQVGNESHWAFYQADQHLAWELEIEGDWQEAAVSSCGGFITLAGHNRARILNAQGHTIQDLPMRDGFNRLQAEPKIDRVISIQGHQLVIYDSQGRLLSRNQGHGSPIQGFLLAPSGGSILTWDEAGWVRLWMID